VLVTENWLESTGAAFAPRGGFAGAAHLTHYTVDYRIWGEGDPIVLVPGLAGGMGLLGPLAKILSQNNKVITYELRGEDNCFAIRRPFGLSDLVGDLHEFLDVVGLESPTLMGVSFGGILALDFASRYPGRVTNLIVQGTGARYQPSILQAIAGTILDRFPLPFDNPFINQFFNLLFGKPLPPGPLSEFIIRQCWSTEQSVMAYRYQLVQTFDMVSRLGNIRVPALVMSSEKDMLVSQKTLRSLIQGISQATHVRLPKTGHLAFVTDADRVADEVRRFLSE